MKTQSQVQVVKLILVLTREAQAIYKVVKGTSLLESYDNEKSKIKQQPSSIVSSDFLNMQARLQTNIETDIYITRRF